MTAGAPRPLRPIRAPRAGGPAARRGAPVRAAVLALAVAAVLAGAGLAGAIQEVPFLAGRVTDQAGLVPAATRERLERKLAELEKRTGAQVAVLTVATLDGEPIEDFAVRVFQSWKLGRRGVDDGVLFVVARQERRMRIEVGYGLESRLTDAVSREILDDRVRPLFRTGDFGGGIEAGVDAIVAIVQGGPLPAPPARAAERAPLLARLLFGALFTVVIGTFSVVALVTPGVAGWFLYLFLTPFYATFPSVIFPPRGGVVAAGLWLVAFPILRQVVRTPKAKAWQRRHGWTVPVAGGGGRWGGSGGGFSGGGGGFSGGGGSSGGGGASSGW